MELDVRPHRRYVAIAHQVLQAIERNQYSAGDRLPPDHEWAATIGVSRSSVREAFLALELAGVIEVRHGEGTFVADPASRVIQAVNATDTPPAELVETRRYIEPICARLVATDPKPGAIDRIRDVIERTAVLVADSADVSEFVELGLTFHTVVADSCRNSLLASIVKNLVSTTDHPLWRLVNENLMRERHAREQQVAEHREILNAIEAGEADTAQRLMEQHVKTLGGLLFVGSRSRRRSE